MKRLIALLTPVHRYLGLVFCLIFAAWFASGLVMIYARMPAYSAAERVARLPRLDPASIHLRPADAVAHAELGSPPVRIRLTTYRSRPVYRLLVDDAWVTVFADDGKVLEPLTAGDALAVVNDAFPEQRGTARLLDTIDRPDQWTIETAFASTGPLHIVALGDSAATNVYVAANTGEVVLKTDRSSRFWGYAGPVMHWFYFTPFRVHGPLWANVIIYGSLAGCCLCVLGLVIGTYRYSLSRRYWQSSATPYVGWLRWHHYAGLIFGVIALAWIFSGMLSMEPWGVSEESAPDLEQVAAIRGHFVDAARFVNSPKSAIDVLHPQFAPKELDLIQFMGRPFYRAQDPGADRTLLVTAYQGPPTIKSGFTEYELSTAAAAVMHDEEESQSAWLTDYDAYYYDRYYDRGRGRPLPVLRVKYADALGSWLYLDPRDGGLVQRETSRGRRVRWLYHGLHSLDFPGLYQAGWLWDAVIVTLCTGGLLLSMTSVIVGWRRLRRAQ